jgi:hypothetical protein
VNARQLAVVRGWEDTRRTLAAWNRRPGPALAPWARLSAAIAVGLLGSVWLVALVSTPDPTPMHLPGVTRPATAADAASIVGRNLLVLALHALACLAGFLARSRLPAEARAYRGWWRRVHDRAGPAALAFVAGATVFSLATQAYALGSGLATLAAQLGTSPGALLLALTPHALPELVALFLPLAAWLVAARARAWHELLAATLTTTALAVPVLVATAVVEVAFTPWLLRTLHFV